MRTGPQTADLGGQSQPQQATISQRHHGLNHRNELIGLNLDADAPVLATPLPTVGQPNTVAVDSRTGWLFVTGTAEGVVQIIEPPHFRGDHP